MSKRKAVNENRDTPKRIHIGKAADVNEKIIRFLKQTVSKQCDEKGNTLLHHVVETENEEFIEYLIDSGCDVNMKNREGDPPLACAVRNNCLKATKILLRKGASHGNSYFNEFQGPLHISASNGFLDIVELLIEHGADVNARDKYKRTPLHAVNYGFYRFNGFCDESRREDDRCKIINVLIENGADVNTKDNMNYSPFTLSISRSFDKGFDLMLSKGADLNEQCYDRPVIFNTIQYGNSPYQMKRLIELGADINVTDGRGESLSHCAFVVLNFEIVNYLLDKGIDIDKKSNNGLNPLCGAMQFFDDGLAIDEGEDESGSYDYDDVYRDNDHLMKDYIKLIEFIEKRGANINLTIPFYYALKIYHCHSNILWVLLRNGATLDFQHPTVQEVMNNSNGSKFPLILLKHAALFEVQKRSDGPANFDVKKLNKQVQKDYLASCIAELELMKATKIENTNVSFFNILFQKDISGYMRNESIVNAFKTQDVSESFPIYHDLLTDRFTKKLAFQSLQREAAKGLSHVLQWDENSTSLVLDNILTFFDEKDLNTLADI